MLLVGGKSVQPACRIVWRFLKKLKIESLKGFGIVNKAEIDVFLELSCFFHDPADVGNLISGSSAFSIRHPINTDWINECS